MSQQQQYLILCYNDFVIQGLQFQDKAKDELDLSLEIGRVPSNEAEI